MIVAIDFTLSNGDPKDRNSLHYVNPDGTTLNQYGTAITSVGSVIEYYDTDQKFPLYGFGGKVHQGQPADHCFPLNGSEGDPDVHGVHGILTTYYESLKTVTLSGPSLFGSIIGQASAIAESTPQSWDSQKYYVLMIITDGIVNDMEATIDAIVNASGLPLSIVIVGVGEADFSDMHRLDGDTVPLKDSRGRSSKRDIVQFCQMSSFKGLSGEAYRSAVAKSVLEELPKQLVQYYQTAGIKPTHHACPPPPPPYSP